MPSLEAYVLVAQDRRQIRVHRRDGSGGWPDTPSVYEQGGALELPGLSSSFAVDEVYRDILDEGGRSLLR